MPVCAGKGLGVCRLLQESHDRTGTKSRMRTFHHDPIGQSHESDIISFTRILFTSYRIRVNAMRNPLSE